MAEICFRDEKGPFRNEYEAKVAAVKKATEFALAHVTMRVRYFLALQQLALSKHRGRNGQMLSQRAPNLRQTFFIMRYSCCPGSAIDKPLAGAH